MQQEQYTTTEKKRKFWKGIFALSEAFNWRHGQILCGLILLKAKFNDRVTLREKKPSGY